MVIDNWLPAVMAVIGYLIGSIPFGVVVTRCLGTVDPRTAGSRNIGFTNVLRVSGKKAGVLTLTGDLGKGWMVAWLAAQIVDQQAWVLVIAMSPILGHLYPIFLGFHGGKGVATALGAVTGIVPVIGALILLIWIVAVAVWRYSSGGAIAAFVLFPVIALGMGTDWLFQLFSVLVSGLILLRHKENLVRLWRGTEPKIGQRSAAV
ncbi:MAG: acyl-phosphate glycerol 3-phosphate acyltransferase [Nitrospiraceae bacterium]